MSTSEVCSVNGPVNLVRLLQVPDQVDRPELKSIRWIQAQMADYGLTMEELAAAGCFDPPPAPPTAADPAPGLLPQRRGAELGRAGRAAGLAAAGGQCGAERGVFQGRITPPVISA